MEGMQYFSPSDPIYVFSEAFVQPHVKRAISYDVEESAKHLRDLLDADNSNRITLKDLQRFAAAAGNERLRQLTEEIQNIQDNPTHVLPDEEGSVREIDQKNEDLPASDPKVYDPSGLNSLPPLESGKDTQNGTGGGPPMWTDTNPYQRGT